VNSDLLGENETPYLSYEEAVIIYEHFFDYVRLPYSTFKKITLSNTQLQQLAGIYNYGKYIEDDKKIDAKFRTYNKEIKIENTLHDLDYHWRNSFVDSSRVPNLNDDNDYYLKVDFGTNCLTMKPKNNIFRLNFTKEKYIEFNYRHVFEEQNNHYLFNNNINMEFEITGDETNFKFYDEVASQRFMTAKIIKVITIDSNINNERLNSIREKRQSKFEKLRI